MNGVNHLLLAVDGSEGSLRAARFAAMLAEATGAELTVLMVHNLEPVMLHAMGPAGWSETVPYSSMSEDEIKALVEQKTDNTEFADVHEAIDNPDLTYRRVQLWGHASQQICNYAKSEGIDLIVIGSRGKTKFAQLLLGSVSSQVASHAPCPVTIVR